MLEGEVLGENYFEPKFYHQLYDWSRGDEEEKASRLAKCKKYSLWSPENTQQSPRRTSLRKELEIKQ